MFKGKEDHWGIKRAVREIFDSNKPRIQTVPQHVDDNELLFDVFFYQFVPDVWKASRESVIRHRQDIEKIITSGVYKKGYIWIKRGNSLKCGLLTPNFLLNIKSVELPTYIEIEKEKTRWQNNPKYNEEQGKTVALEEEYVQLRIIKK